MNPLVVVEQLLLLMLVMLIGYSVARMKLLDDQAEMNFATLINYVTVPALICRFYFHHYICPYNSTFKPVIRLELC